MPKNIFNSLKRYVDRAKSNARSAIMRASYVDTRSDTTRKGYHEGRTRYGYNYGANENGITGTIARIIDGKDYNPYLQTGIAPMPDKIASPKDISRIYKIFKKVTNPKITIKNASKITPKQWTAAQDAAIARGDIAEAQRLRDLHSNVYGDPIISYHGQMMPNKMYISRRANPYSDVRVAYNASGYFSSSSNPVANTYNFIDGSPTFKLYTHFKNPYIIDAEGKNWRTIGTDKIYRDYVEKGKHDGAVIRNVMDVGPRRDKLNGASDIADDIISSPGHSKLADAVTYDDKGVRIPLGDRDNFNVNDIRWSWLLPIFGVGAATAVNAKNKNKSKLRLGGIYSLY